MKESGKERLKSTIYESTLSTADAVPLPRWGRQISSGYAANIYGAMPEGGEQSPATRNHACLLSNYGVQRVLRVLRVLRVQVAASPRSRAQAAAVLAFVISHTTFSPLRMTKWGDARRLENRSQMSGV